MIGRQTEYKRLDTCMKSEDPQLVAVYGRRRVGKTYLINSYFDGRFDFKLTGMYDQPLSIQLKNFIIEYENQTGLSREVPKDWLEAFGILREYIKGKSEEDKVVIFFDEMPWMDTARSGFLAAFEWFWNGYGNSRKNLIFILCGSAMSWMREHIDNNKGGLYKRLTCRIYLLPFSLGETEEYFKSKGIEWSRYNITECYMIMGGIPYYLSLIDPERTYNANIDNIFFRKRAELWDEFTFLYQTLFKNSDQYKAVVEALSKKKSGLSRNELIEVLHMPNNGNITEILDNLEYSGFVRINDTFGKKKKVYQLSDYYTLFYYRFIKDNYGKDEKYWSNTLDNPARRSWAGLTFEQVCKDHIPQIKKKLGIYSVLSEISVWSIIGDDEHTGAQIDMLIDRRDHVTNLCEIKFSSSEFEIDKEYDKVLRNKISAFSSSANNRNTLQLTMITTYGVKQNKYSSLVNSQVVLDDLFEVN